LAAAPGGPLRLAVNSKAVFWVNQTSSSTVSKVGLDGTGLTVLATNGGAGWGIAVDESDVYWSTNEPSPTWGAVKKVSVSGGTVSVLYSPVYLPRDVAIDANNVYFTGYEGGTGQVPKAGGTAINTITGYGPWDVFADKSTGYSYWLNWDLHSIQRVPIGGGTAQDVVKSLSFMDTIQSIAARDTSIVFASNSQVSEVSMFGGNVTVLAASQTNAYGIAADSSGVYWTSKTASGTITRYDAGGVAVLATGQNMPTGIALDATTIYWANSGSNQIMKLAK